MVCYISPFLKSKEMKLINIKRLSQFLNAVDLLFVCDHSIVFQGDFNFPDVEFSSVDFFPDA